MKKTFRDYEHIIRYEIKKISDKDPNWDFSVKAFSRYKIEVRWSYLDYLEEKNNCFFLKLCDYDRGCNEYTLVAETPHQEIINSYTCVDCKKKSWQYYYEEAIREAIQEIAYYAHSRY